MNQQQIQQTASIGTPPALDITFDGLFFLCFNTGGEPAKEDPADECRIGFLTTAPQHLITIVGRRAGVTNPDFAFVLSHAQARRVQIALDVPGVKTPSVTRKGHDQTIDRMFPNEATEDYFKWIIDLENQEMHDQKLTPIANVLKPVLSIKIGEFYTKELSRVKYFRTRVDKPDKNFGSVAAVTGVRIAALPEGKAFLKLGSDISLPLVTPAGQTYEVTFQNRCPKCDEEQVGSLHLSDFPLHYHAFDVKVLDQYDFDFPDPPAAPPAICYAASGSQTTNI